MFAELCRKVCNEALIPWCDGTGWVSEHTCGCSVFCMIRQQHFHNFSPITPVHRAQVSRTTLNWTLTFKEKCCLPKRLFCLYIKQWEPGQESMVDQRRKTLKSVLIKSSTGTGTLAVLCHASVLCRSCFIRNFKGSSFKWAWVNLSVTHTSVCCPPLYRRSTKTAQTPLLLKQCACLSREWCHCRTAVGERLECYSLLTEAKDCGMKRPRKMFVHV